MQVGLCSLSLNTLNSFSALNVFESRLNSDGNEVGRSIEREIYLKVENDAKTAEASTPKRN